jgi:uncharacterized GH25 family protein
MNVFIQSTPATKTRHKIFDSARRALLFTAFVLLIFSPHVRAQDSQAAAGQSLDDQELAIDKQHLRKIYDAIQAYKKKNGDLPSWLSDLFPEFLSDPNVLMSPVELRTGQSQLWGYPDPKMRTSYTYEFSQATANTRDEQGKELTLKEKKMIQMQEYGPVIPLLRCHLHSRVLNMSYSGDIYQTALFWESDASTRELMAKLGPGPGPKDAKRMRVTVLDADTGKPLKEADIETSKMIAMSLPLPPRESKTDANGQCEINLVSKNQETLALRVGRAGYVTSLTEWSKGEMPGEWTVKLQKGAPIGGVVRDPGGKPIRGVSVSVTTIQRNQSGDFTELEADAVTTDASGKWTTESLPTGFKSLTLNLSHADFRPAMYNMAASESVAPGEVSKADLVGLEAVLVMKPGITIGGVVADAAGKPLAGAQVFFQQSVEEPKERLTSTDAAGRFTFRIMEVGQGTISVTAQGFASQSSPVSFDDDMKPVDFKLTP